MTIKQVAFGQSESDGIAGLRDALQETLDKYLSENMVRGAAVVGVLELIKADIIQDMRERG